MSNKILLLEDDLILAETLQELLEENSYKVDLATTGAEAADLSYENSYDLYIFDINVPEMDGFEATVQIRDAQSEVLSHDVPIIAMTAHAVKGYKERSLAVGMNDYITKPLKRRDLLALIEKWVFPEPETIDIT